MDLANAVAAAMPAVIARIPPTPAAELGRLGAPEPPRDRPRRGYARPAGGRGEPPGLGSLSDLLVERLLGALELTIPGLEIDAPAGLTAQLPPGVTGQMAFAWTDRESEVSRATRTFHQVRPGATELVSHLVKALARNETVGRLLTVEGEADEATVAARHGAAHLALAVIVATAVLRELGGWTSTTPAIVGTALAAAVPLLKEAPMPAGYANALMHKRREEYLLPQYASGRIQVTGHRFALSEGPFPESPDFSSNGLVAPVSSGAAIRTGIEEGWVSVDLRVLGEPPESVDETGWDEVVEVSWTAATGWASLGGGVHATTPPWPGEYRLRVHASRRDDPGETESYELIVWPAPAAPEIVHKRTDRLGYRLRGEPEPERAPEPDRKYRWVRKELGDAATITVVTGATADEVVRGFRANPAEWESLRHLSREFGVTPSVSVLQLDGAVLAIEANGWQGSTRPVLGAISRGGRAASMYWSVNADTRLSLAERGEVLASFEPGLQSREGPDELFEDIDFADYRDTIAKGLVVVERFTGQEVLPPYIERLREEGVAHPILE